MKANRRIPRQVRRRDRRGALLSAEMLLVMPVAVAIFFAIVQFSLMLSAHSQMERASQVGARVGTLPGATQTHVEEAVRATLETRLTEAGNSLGIAYTPGVATGDDVTVTVTIDMADATPDLLFPLGFSLTGRTLEASTTMRKE